MKLLSSVLERVKLGGHGIEKVVLKRRYYRGIRNFFKIYMELVEHWVFIDNSTEQSIKIAEGGINSVTEYYNEIEYKEILDKHYD